MTDNTKSAENQLTTDNAKLDSGNSRYDPEFDLYLNNVLEVKVLNLKKDFEVDRYGKIINVSSSNSDFYSTKATSISRGDFAGDTIVAPEKIGITNEDSVKNEKIEEILQTLMNDLMPICVENAEDYALHIGLSLDDTATKCWDNPLTLNVNNLSLDDKIKIRLDKYKKVLGFTAVWVWAEKAAGAEYKIYIGCR